METRREPRHSPLETARITVLDAAGTAVVATIANVSAGGMQLILPSEIAPESAIRIDLPDALILAEIRYCHRTAEGQWLAGAETQHVLNGLRDLAALADRLLGRQPRVPEAIRS